MKFNIKISFILSFIIVFNFDKIFISCITKNANNKIILSSDENKIEKAKFRINNSFRNTNNNQTSLYRIIDYKTHIKIGANKTNSKVSEEVTYEIKSNTLTTIIHKVSLNSTANSFTRFLVDSKDFKVKDIKILQNCLDYTSETESVTLAPYICVLTTLDEVEDNKIGKLTYNYIANDFIKVREGTLSDTKKDVNYFIWNFDNLKRQEGIKNFSFTAQIENKFYNMTKIKEFPATFSKNVDSKNNTILNWMIDEIQANQVEWIVCELPLFNFNSYKNVNYFLF